jgi:hypothetical protein
LADGTIGVFACQRMRINHESTRIDTNDRRSQICPTKHTNDPEGLVIFDSEAFSPEFARFVGNLVLYHSMDFFLSVPSV